MNTNCELNIYGFPVDCAEKISEISYDQPLKGFPQVTLSLADLLIYELAKTQQLDPNLKSVNLKL